MKNQPKCHLCQNRVKIFLDYDYPLYVRPVEKKDLKKVRRWPLVIGFCRRCNHIMQLAPPVKALEQVYKKFYQTFHSTVLSGIGSREADNFADFVNKNNAGGNLLEIGCSDGYFLRQLQKKGWQVFGCDPSPRTRIAVEKFKIPVKKSLFRQDLFKQKFDCIAARHVLEHIKDAGGFLKEVAGALAPGGSLAIEVPNVIHTLKFGVIGSFIHEHISYFTPQSLENFLKKIGYETVSLAERRNVIYWLGRRAGHKLDIRPIKAKDKNITENLIDKYIKILKRLKRELLAVQKDCRLNNYNLYLYGGGGHTMGLLNLAPLKVKAIIDQDKSKTGKFLPGFKNIPVDSDDFLKILAGRDLVIISSEFFQDEIVERLRPYAAKGVKILKLYPKCEYL